MNKTLDEITPIVPGVVKMYTCGPTVYRDAHIGNLRSYLMADWVRRILELQGLEVQHIKTSPMSATCARKFWSRAKIR